MTNAKVIENKISSVKKYLKILERYRKYSKEEIKGDVDIKGMIERYLYLAVQSTIDLAEALISLKNFRKPTTMGEAFRILYEEKIISSPLKDRLTNMVGFRNILAHDYEEMNYDILYDILHHSVKDINKFLALIP
ncbi:MAG: DUF86 domain-containing protein [Elusimicrobia bacterium]|nr:DUF86 domain-containing protein [Elusimicrobiota bacterium]